MWKIEKVEITIPKEFVMPNCPYCDSSNVIKYYKHETKKGKVQVYKCKTCERYFSINDRFHWRHFTPEIITSALDLYFKGISLRQIADHINQFHNRKIHHTTILKWIQSYMKLIEGYLSQFKPILSGLLNLDETGIKINSENHWLWNVMDDDTKFLVASHITKYRGHREAVEVFDKVKQVIPNPKAIVTDKLRSYISGYNQAFKGKNNLVHSVGFKHTLNNNPVEQLHGTFKQRTKTMRGIRSRRNPEHIALCNYLRKHSSIDSTPANLRLKGNK